MKIIQKEIDHKTIANNCPECFANDTLSLTLYQQCTEGIFLKRITDEITNTLKCTKCNTDIYPVRWTEDIERVYEFYLKSIQPNKPSSKLTKLSYILIAFTIIALASVVAITQFHEEVRALF